MNELKLSIRDVILKNDYYLLRTVEIAQVL